ncbi:MAG: hypothetical protein V1799_12615 [bacterium]
MYRTTGTIWENYSPDAQEPGRNTDGKLVMKDFVGWSGIGPILYFMEYAVGIKANADANALYWQLESKKRVGCEGYRFNDHVISLIAEKSEKNHRKISIESNGVFLLHLRTGNMSKTYSIHEGRNELIIR